MTLNEYLAATIDPLDRPQGIILDRVDPADYPAMKAAAAAEREWARRILNPKGK